MKLEAFEILCQMIKKGRTLAEIQQFVKDTDYALDMFSSYHSRLSLHK